MARSETAIGPDGTVKVTIDTTAAKELHGDQDHSYRIVAEVSSNNRESFGLSFSVAEYRTPEFQVDAVPAADQVVQGDTVQVAVEASYFFGGTTGLAR